MSKKQHTVEQIITKLREAEVLQSKGQRVVKVCRVLGITEPTYYRWRKKYRGLQVDRSKRFVWEPGDVKVQRIKVSRNPATRKT